MLGYAHAAGFRDGPRPDIESIARCFSLPTERLARTTTLIESAERPEVLLLQNLDRDAKVGAVTLFSSVWSKSYAKVGTAYGAVHRDFHSSEISCVDLVMLRCTLTRSCSSGKTYFR